MASLNKAIIIGNAGKDPEIRYTASGTAVASLTIATTEKYKNKGGEWEEKTEWHNVTMWGKLAEICGEYVQKGQTLYVEGRIETRKWQDKDGKDRYTTGIVGDKMLMLGGKRESGGGNSGGAGYGGVEPSFNPDDDIPFLLPPHLMA